MLGFSVGQTMQSTKERIKNHIFIEFVPPRLLLAKQHSNSTCRIEIATSECSIHAGGQIEIPRYNIKGWLRSSIRESAYHARL